MFDRLDDTIAAISSPPGIGIRGIIRLSGPDAFKLADSLFIGADARPLAAAGGHERHFGSVRLDESARLPAEAYTFRAPASYTRQDLVELHTIGSPPALAVLLEQLIRGGARVALPGEFTARAFFAGALDLTAVEGVAAMIHAQSDAQLRASETLLHGGLSRRTRELREELADLLALVEAEIDFAEEPIEFVSPASVQAIIQSVSARLQELLARGESVERLEVLPRVVLAGLPNAGKSTLFNRLTGVDRAIQSAVAGTTRDVVTAPLELAGGEVICCDTAGFWSEDCASGCSQSAAALAQAIQTATQRALDSADLILLVVDGADDPDRALAELSGRFEHRCFEIVLNKIDATVGSDVACREDVFACVSALSGQGLDQLLLRLSQALFAGMDKHGAELISLTQRHRGALEDARDALVRADDMLRAHDGRTTPTELLALEIRHAVHALSLLLGEVTTEDILGRIFSRFCIGK